MNIDYELWTAEDFATRAPIRYVTGMLLGGAIALGFIVGFLARWVMHG